MAALKVEELMALEVLGQVFEQGLNLEKQLKKCFRRHRQLSNPQRRRCALLVHGVSCYRLRFAYLSRVLSVFRENMSHYLAFYWTEHSEESLDTLAERFVLSVEALEKLRCGDIFWPEDPLTALEVRYSYPRWMLHQWRKSLNVEQCAALADSFNQAGPIAIRVQQRKNSHEELSRSLEEQGMRVETGKLAPYALRLLGKPDIRTNANYLNGNFEVQDEGSQLIGFAVGAQPGETIWDMCAGSGGKTMALADAMADQGQIWATDIDVQRLQDLKLRARRNGLSCVNAQTISDCQDKLPLFDRVLVDAPCTSSGTFRRGPHRKWTILPQSLGCYSDLQLQLLLQAAKYLRPGGRLVYATCSVFAEENSRVKERLLGREPSLLEDSLGTLEVFSGQSELQLYPHLHDTDGFYLAAFKKRSAP